MANVLDDDNETLDFADESEYIGDDPEDEELATVVGAKSGCAGRSG